MPSTTRPTPVIPVVARVLALALGATLLAACRPEPPPTDKPPEPQARANTELRDAIQAPQDKARSVQKTMQEDEARQRAQADAAEEG